MNIAHSYFSFYQSEELLLFEVALSVERDETWACATTINSRPFEDLVLMLFMIEKRPRVIVVW